MPEVFREGPYRFFFYSNENDEPTHVHVRVEDRFAKFWMEPIELAYSRKMRPAELRNVRSIIEKRQIEIIDKWHAHFDSQG